MLQIKVFGATPPCANCKRAEAQAQQAAARFPGHVEVVKLDALGPEAEQYGLMTTPLVVVGVLEHKETGSENLELCCYHNPFAKVPIEPNLLAELASNQYCFDDPHEGMNVRWEPKLIEI